MALPSCGINSVSPSNLVCILSLIKLPKSFKACLGFSNTDINFSPKSANKSTRLPVIAPITPIILANLFCPSSELVNALPTAVIAKTNAPIPVAATANLRTPNCFIAPVTVPLSALKPLIAPPVALSAALPIAFTSLEVSFEVVPTSLTPLCNSFNWALPSLVLTSISITSLIISCSFNLFNSFFNRFG